MKRLAAAMCFGLMACSGSFPVDNESVGRARSESDVVVLVAALDRAESWHVENETGVAQALNPGASTDQIRSAFEAIPVKPTGELIALWSWHDGGTGDRPLFWFHEFLSAEEAAGRYSSLMRNPLIRWDGRFVPLLEFEGEWFAVYCGPDRLPAGPVVHYFLEEGSSTSFTNLTTFALTMAEAFENDAVRWDTQLEAMTEDIAAVAGIHAKYNAGCQFPYYVDQP